MKTTTRLMVVILVLAIATFGEYSTAEAVNLYNFRGLGANASFSSVDGCIRTNVDIFTAEATLQTSPGSGDPFSSVNIFINQYDTCTDPETRLLTAEGVADLAESDLQIDTRLNWAQLNTVVTMVDTLSGNTFDAAIDLIWNGNAPVTREHSVLHDNLPGCIHINRFIGTFRSADAYGSVSSGMTNFTPEPSLGALLISSKSADMSIDCIDLYRDAESWIKPDLSVFITNAESTPEE